jgi:hypothetical protein
MTIKNFEHPIIQFSDNLVYRHAKLIDKEYKLDIKDLNAEERLSFVSKFLSLHSNLDAILQEYIDDSCSERTCAESDIFGNWDYE